MKYGYPDLNGVITDPEKALDRILKGYFYSDTRKLSLDLPTNSLRSDMVDGNDHVGNIKRSLDYILSCYFDVYVVEVNELEVVGNNRHIELMISITDEGAYVTFDNILKLDNGSLRKIVGKGHL